MFRLALLLPLAFAASAVAAPVPKEIKKTVPKLDGTWEVTEWFSQGNKINSSVTIRWTVDGEKLTIQRSNVKGVGGLGGRAVSYSLVPVKDGPANALDYTLTYPNGGPAPRSYPAVFEMDGDTLKVCYSSSNPNGGAPERPTECKAAVGNILYVFKRVEADK